MARRDIRLLDNGFDEVGLYQDFARRFATSGAVASFAGRVRPKDKAVDIEALYLDWYPGMSEQSLEKIALDAEQRFDLHGVMIIHRCAQVLAGEVIVLVCAASDHRRAAFEAVDYMMDHLKSEAALWKREIGKTEEGAVIERWVEPTAKDRLDLSRWQKDDKHAQENG